MQIKWVIAALVILLLSAGGSVVAMSSGTHDIPVSSVNSGGEARSSTGYQLLGATGQSAIGNSNSGAHRLGAGYIPMVISRGSESEMIITSCDGSGTECNQFMPGETVYVKGEGLQPGTEYHLWIQQNTVSEGHVLAVITPAGNNGNPINPVTVSTDVNGKFAATPVWTIPSDAPITFEEFDIVANQVGGDSHPGIYNESEDGLDSTSAVGFVAPMPEMPVVLLLGAGLVALAGLIWLGRRRRLMAAG